MPPVAVIACPFTVTSAKFASNTLNVALLQYVAPSFMSAKAGAVPSILRVAVFTAIAPLVPSSFSERR